ncbi:MAG: FAD-dependent oxidoreductase [Planctomycetes bacterium]|nr:FAD-dependent oxidoreductase [Planctomycetota bacterium]
MRTRQFDVVVVGGGGAALRAAIAAHEAGPGLEVALLTKGKLGESGVTATACSDRMAYHATLKHTEPRGADAWRYHAEDVYRIGGCVSDADLAATLARNAGESFYYLDELGVPFAKRDDGLADQFVTDGSEYARACYTGPYTANHIEQALVRKIRTTPVKIIENTMALEIIKDGDKAAGLLIIDTESEEYSAVAAKAVVLATGGAGELFAVNVFPEGMTGDGQAMALRAGAELVNMEFIQIGLSSVKTKLACSGSMFRALPRLVNSDGDEFLPNYYKGDAASMFNILFKKGASWPVSKEEPSSVIDIAVAKENARGKKVYLDYSANPAGLDLASLDEKLRSWYTDTKAVNLDAADVIAGPLARLKLINAPVVEWLAERGIDLAKGDKIELAPATQHFQGGIKILKNAGTCIPGLYAAGEAAGGQHGANRPGGNALMDSQVFGKIAGESAAGHAREVEQSADVEATAEALADETSRKIMTCCPGGCGKFTAAEGRERIQSAMSLATGVVRTEAGIKRAINAVCEVMINGIFAYQHGAAHAIETLNMIDSALAVLTACRARKESRGPHLFFEDETTITPMDRSDDFEKYVVVGLKDGRLTTEWREPVRTFD